MTSTHYRTSENNPVLGQELPLKTCQFIHAGHPVQPLSDHEGSDSAMLSWH